MKSLRSAFISWIPLGIAITCVSLIAYVGVQQVYRQSANDPQTQLAGDIATALTNGSSPDQLDQKTRVDVFKSLAPFVIVYNDQGQPLASSGILHNQIPRPPEGVFRQVRFYGEDRLTWQPEPLVRIAAVVTSYNGGFVLVGRSLREVEKRIAAIGYLMLGGWAFTMLATFTVSIFLQTLGGPKRSLRSRIVERFSADKKTPEN